MAKDIKGLRDFLNFEDGLYISYQKQRSKIPDFASVLTSTAADQNKNGSVELKNTGLTFCAPNDENGHSASVFIGDGATILMNSEYAELLDARMGWRVEKNNKWAPALYIEGGRPMGCVMPISNKLRDPRGEDRKLVTYEDGAIKIAI